MKTCRICRRDISHLSYKELCSMHYIRQRKKMPLDLPKHDLSLPGYSKRRKHVTTDRIRRQRARHNTRQKWQRKNGPIPKGMELHHKDFNPFNRDLNNLILVSKKKHKRIHREAKIPMIQ